VNDLALFHTGVFASTADGPVLLGGRCRACGQVYHPRVAVCLNCTATDLDDIRLSRHGRLECCTTVHMPTTTMAAPYTVGYVQLPEGLRIFAPIGSEASTLAVGTPMTLAEFTIGRGAQRQAAYCFVPTAGGA